MVGRLRTLVFRVDFTRMTDFDFFLTTRGDARSRAGRKSASELNGTVRSFNRIAGGAAVRRTRSGTRKSTAERQR